jgi:small-conductance mechanosensitive channel
MFLDQVYFDNSIQNWLIAGGFFILTWILLRLIISIVKRKIKKIALKSETDIDDLIANLLDKVKLIFILFISLFASAFLLKLPENITNIINKAVIIVLLWQGAIWGNTIISFWINRLKKKKMAEDAASATTYTALGFISQLILWSLVLLLALDNLGVDVTALVTGLGIGGIAIALAVQNVLGDLFASLSIILDKPFVLGDFIIVDTHMGTIEHIGLKTTRIRSLSGEQLIFSNSDLLTSRIRNFKRMSERRVVFKIGVTYQTDEKKLRLIPQLIKDIIEDHDLTRFDRAHFQSFADFALNYEIVYWMQTPDYNKYMDVQQSINLEIYRTFAEHKIEFAYPTQTIFLNKE